MDSCHKQGENVIHSSTMEWTFSILSLVIFCLRKDFVQYGFGISWKKTFLITVFLKKTHKLFSKGFCDCAVIEN